MTKLKHQKQTTAQLKKDGFVKVDGLYLIYINAKGEAVNSDTGKKYKPNNRNDIYIEGKRQSLPKLILNVFAKQPIRPGQITYLDGNRGNLAVKNLKYSRIFEPSTTTTVNQTDLMTAIRCYYRVPTDYKTKNLFLTRIYLQGIIEYRCFYLCHVNSKNIEVFKEYISGKDQTNITTAKAFNMSVRDVNIIVNQYVNLLVDEILQDLSNGFIKIQDYRQKQPTQTEKIKKINAEMIKNGLQPLPLRKLSQKEMIKKFHEHNRKILDQPES